MPMGKPISAKDWMLIRTAYIVQGWSSAKCAEQFGFNETTIKKRASAEGWTAKRTTATTDATAAATEQIAKASLEAIASLREQHASIVERMHHDVLDKIDEDLAAIKPGRSRIEARAKAAEAFALVLKNSRLVLGIVEGTSSMTDAADTGARKIEFELIETAEAESA